MSTVQHALLAAILLALGVGCDRQKSGAPPSIPDEPDAAEEAGTPAPSGPCELVDGACAPEEACCRQHAVGRRVDLARECYSRTKEILACQTSIKGDRECGVQEDIDCVTRIEPDGGIAVFFTPHYWEPWQIPGYEKWDRERCGRVALAGECP